MPDYQEEESLGSFTPDFALPDLELLRLYAGSSTRMLQEEENERIMALIGGALHPQEEIEDSHALGYKCMLGALGSSVGRSDYKGGPDLSSDDKDTFLFLLKMFRREKYIQFVYDYYSAGSFAMEKGDPRYIEDPQKWNFNSKQEAFGFIKQFTYLTDQNEGFNIFVGWVVDFLRPHDSFREKPDSPRRGPKGFTDKEVKVAKVGMLNFFLFNQMYPVFNEDRARALEGLDIPPEETRLLNLMDENSVYKLLENEAECIELARFIVDYFTDFNLRP